MQDFDSVIRKMIENKVITLEDGLSFATNQNNLLLQLKGLSSSEDYATPNRPSHIPESMAPPPPAAMPTTSSVLDMMD